MFVATSGTVRGVGRPAALPAPSRIALSTVYAADYAEIWRTQPSVRTVVSFLARNIAQLGLPVYERVGDTDRRRVGDHPVAKLLRQPNPWTTRYRFINALVHDCAIYDNAYWWKTRLDGKTASLVRVPPTMVKPVGDDWMTPEAFEINGGKGKTVLPAEQVVYFRGYNVDSDVGVSPLEALRMTLREAYTGSEMREQIMRNGARVSGYLTRPAAAPKWSAEARERFRGQWQAQYSGVGPGAGGTPILEDDMAFVPASQTARDLQYVEGRKLSREEVASAYHIPPPMVGILDHATFSNISEQRKMLYTETLGPWLSMFEEEIKLQVISEFDTKDKLYCEFNIREKLSGDFLERGNIMAQAIGGPYLTVNEGRAMDNRPPIEGGDELIRPLNVTTNGSQDPVPADPQSASTGSAA